MSRNPWTHPPRSSTPSHPSIPSHATKPFLDSLPPSRKATSIPRLHTLCRRRSLGNHDSYMGTAWPDLEETLPFLTFWVLSLGHLWPCSTWPLFGSGSGGSRCDRNPRPQRQQGTHRVLACWATTGWFVLGSTGTRPMTSSNTKKLASFRRMFFDIGHQLIRVSRDFLREVREQKAQTQEIKSLFRALLWKFSKSYPLGRFFSSTP